MRHAVNQSFSLFFFLALVFVGSASLASEENLRVLGHRVPPFSMHDEKGKVSGFSADLYKLVHEKIYGSQNVSIIPVTFNRLYAELQNAEKRIGITVGRNTKREKLFHWVGPYLTIHLGVVGKKNKNAQVRSVEDFEGYTIATIENTAPEQALKKMGIAPSLLIRDLYPQRSLIRLDHDRVDFMAYPLQALSYLMSQNSIDADTYEEVFRIREIQLYFALSKDFTTAEVQTYQKALEEVLASPDFTKLKDKYALDGLTQ